MIVKVYVTPSCVYCDLVKLILEDYFIDYEEIDISKDKDSADEIIKKAGILAVPIVDINGRIIVGFDRRKIEQVIWENLNEI